MQQTASFTIPQLVTALKKAGFPTKQDVEDIVHNQLTEFHANMTLPEISKLRNEMQDGFKQTAIGFKQVNKRLDKLESGVSFIKDDVKNLKLDTPTRHEFEDLKHRVRKTEIAQGEI